MNHEKWTPNIIIGIDFGMTCTGVAYSRAPDWAEPRIIQSWPGLGPHELRNKVKSALKYRVDSPYVESWGFATDTDALDANTFNLFKLNLDERYQDPSENPLPPSDARACLRDYLRCVREHVEHRFEESDPHFSEMNIEYVFSTPTTWTEPGMVHSIEMTLREAGFANGFNRRIKIGLTEAEAAAVQASKNNHRESEVILVCDAGGGTTDVNILRIRNAQRKHVGLDQLGCVEGESIGSALIDFQVKKLVTRRLEAIRSHLILEPKDCATLMMRQKFEDFKCSFGLPGWNQPNIVLPIPDLAQGADFPEARVRDGKMLLSRDEVQGIFDDQIDKMFDLIQAQLTELQRSKPGEIISYLVLSGGLGSSPYVKQRLKGRSENELKNNFPCAFKMQFLTVEDAQTAVVRGLVSDRVQEVDSGIRVFTEVCARSSYGVLCRELYNPQRHLGEPVNKDKRDGKSWAEGQIHWLIKKGQTVSTSPEKQIEHPYLLKINLGNEQKPWRTDVVTSDRSRDDLPQSLRRPGARILCNLQSVLDSQDMKRKNRHWYNFAPEYNRAQFIVRVLVGHSDLKFQILSRDRKRVSRDHDQIQVQWDPPQKGVGVEEGEEVLDFVPHKV